MLYFNMEIVSINLKHLAMWKVPEHKQTSHKQARWREALTSWILGKFFLMKIDCYLLADVPRPQYWQLDSISASDKENSKQKISALSPLISEECQVTASWNIFNRHSYVNHNVVAMTIIWLCLHEVWKKNLLKDASENTQSRSDCAFLHSPADTKPTVCYCCAVVKLPRVVPDKNSHLFKNLGKIKGQD